MTDVKPIETRYAGHRFRSRLEARWAVFFDRLGIPWRYECEGYELSDGTRYLPDFYLPDAQSWVEVKGVMSQPDLRKIVRACTELPGAGGRVASVNLVLLGEIPRTSGSFVHSGFMSIGSSPVWIQTYFSRRGAWRLQPIGDGVTFEIHDLDNEDSIRSLAGFCGTVMDALMEPDLHTDLQVSAAYAAARTARFEHGECG